MSACRRGISEGVRILRSTRRRLGAQALVLWLLALRLEHAQEDARIRAEPRERSESAETPEGNHNAHTVTL